MEPKLFRRVYLNEPPKWTYLLYGLTILMIPMVFVMALFSGSWISFGSVLAMCYSVSMQTWTLFFRPLRGKGWRWVRLLNRHKIEVKTCSFEEAAVLVERLKFGKRWYCEEVMSKGTPQEISRIVDLLERAATSPSDPATNQMMLAALHDYIHKRVVRAYFVRLRDATLFRLALP
jgi:hypothetical protein